ncbi:MAG: hypothetical protein AB7G44_12830 [Bacteroidia bacterium]
MKKLYSLPAGLMLVVILFIAGCGKADEKCEGEEKVTGFNSMNPTEFDRLLAAPDILEFATYRTAYSENINSSGMSAFALQTTVTGACSYEPVFVTSMLELVIADADVKDTLSVQSTGNYFVQSVLPNGTLYMANEYFDTKGSTGSVDLILKHVVWIPYKGSRDADSLYFWGNVVNWRLGSQFRLPD